MFMSNFFFTKQKIDDQKELFLFVVKKKIEFFGQQKMFTKIFFLI